MSRKVTTTRQDKDLIKLFKMIPIPEPLMQWLKDPIEDWDLPIKIVDNM